MAGIVRLQKGVKGGAFIQTGDAGRMSEVVRDMLSLGSISVEELTETRLHIQDLVVRLACQRATAADFEALEANIERTEQMTVEGRYLDRVECSREFYRLLVAAAHNQVLSMMVRSVTEILMQFVYTRVAAGGKPQPRLVEKRRAFLAALRERDPETATQLMRSHLVSVHRLLEPFIDAGRASPPAPAGASGAG
jgi:DNA-binding FadR family transcriptional regulator